VFHLNGTLGWNSHEALNGVHETWMSYVMSWKVSYGTDAAHQLDRVTQLRELLKQAPGQQEVINDP
jgi:hypothetical protein